MFIDHKLVQELAALSSQGVSSLDNFHLRIEPYWDYEGEQSLKVWVILAESQDLSSISAHQTLALKEAIRAKVGEFYPELFTYVNFAKQSEIDAANEELVVGGDADVS